MKFIVKFCALFCISLILSNEWFFMKCHCETENLLKNKMPSDHSFRRYFQKFADSSIDKTPVILDESRRAFKFVPERILRRNLTEMLDLGDNKLTELPKELANLKKLEYINLVSNQITNMSLVSVVNELPNLESLVLSGNPLKSLKGLRTNSLQILEADNCEIREIEDLFLESMPSLRILNLTGNPLKIMRKMTSSNLTDLMLMNCQLTNLPQDTFEGLQNLRYLNLCDNKLSTMPDRIFFHNNNLIHLSLSNNTFDKLKDIWFDEKDHLTQLDLSENKLTTIDENVFVELIALTDLDLGHNDVVALPNLKTTAYNVNLTKNSIKNQILWDLSNMKNLRSLDLSENRFDGECDEFKSTTLRILDLAHNNMTRIRRNSFRDLPNLSSLNLKGNQFSHGNDVMVFDDNKILAEVELENNPWDCNCTDLYPLYSYVARGQRTRTTSLVCWTPENVKGDTWWEVCSEDWRENLTVDEQVESSKTWLIAISAAFGVCLLLGTIIYIVYTFKKYRSRRIS